MDVNVFGMGYAGLIPASALADVAHHVLRADVDQSALTAIAARSSRP